MMCFSRIKSYGSIVGFLLSMLSGCNLVWSSTSEKINSLLLENHPWLLKSHEKLRNLMEGSFLVLCWQQDVMVSWWCYVIRYYIDGCWVSNEGVKWHGVYKVRTFDLWLFAVVLHRGLRHGSDEGFMVFMREHWLIFMQDVRWLYTDIGYHWCRCMKILGMT